MASESASDYDFLQPYQFEPRRKQEEQSDESDWETCSDSSSDAGAVKTIRVQLPASDWCKCKNCQPQMTDLECVCCQELEKSKAMSKSASVGKE